MKVLVIGGGGREHALVWKLAQSPHVSQVFCSPGNGGTAREAKCRNVQIAADDVGSLVRFAEEERIDLTVVGPELPLTRGIIDQWPKGLRIWGPNAQQAQLEGSKVYTNQLMAHHNIPTARFFICGSPPAAHDAINEFSGGRCVVKADGLAGGKGALMCRDHEAAKAAVEQLMVAKVLGDAGERVVIEEWLKGWETSLMVLCARDELIPLATAQDYKRIGDGDTGPNTGGMGAYSPVERFTDELLAETLEKIVHPIVAATGFTGVLYAGLMVTEEGPKVLEFNVRFGDPEIQVVLPRMKTGLFELLYGGAEGKFPTTHVDWSPEAAVTVVMAAEGYPGKPRKGDVISGLDLALETIPGLIVFHAGTDQDNLENIIVSGGRVLDVTALAATRRLARTKAYLGTKQINWPGVQYRTDIAA